MKFQVYRKELISTLESLKKINDLVKFRKLNNKFFILEAETIKDSKFKFKKSSSLEIVYIDKLLANEKICFDINANNLLETIKRFNAEYVTFIYSPNDNLILTTNN